MAEQSNARVCKTRALTGYLGANPSPSTIEVYIVIGSENTKYSLPTGSETARKSFLEIQIRVSFSENNCKNWQIRSQAATLHRLL